MNITTYEEWLALGKERGWRQPNGRILVLDEKHGERYFAADTDEVLHEVALALVRERLENDWYQHEEDRVTEILESGNGARAWEFLRGGSEYGGVRLEEVLGEVPVNGEFVLFRYDPYTAGKPVRIAASEEVRASRMARGTDLTPPGIFVGSDGKLYYVARSRWKPQGDA